MRAFGRELREMLEYARSRNSIVRKELFAHRRELWLWTSWGFALSAVNVSIVWYGGHSYMAGSPSIGERAAGPSVGGHATGGPHDVRHRLSTIRRADLILLLDDGRIVERGAHSELMARRGIYYEMVVRQAASGGKDLDRLALRE